MLDVLQPGASKVPIHFVLQGSALQIRSKKQPNLICDTVQRKMKKAMLSTTNLCRAVYVHRQRPCCPPQTSAELCMFTKAAAKSDCAAHRYEHPVDFYLSSNHLRNVRLYHSSQ